MTQGIDPELTGVAHSLETSGAVVALGTTVELAGTGVEPFVGFAVEWGVETGVGLAVGDARSCATSARTCTRSTKFTSFPPTVAKPAIGSVTKVMFPPAKLCASCAKLRRFNPESIAIFCFATVTKLPRVSKFVNVPSCFNL